MFFFFFTSKVRRPLEEYLPQMARMDTAQWYTILRSRASCYVYISFHAIRAEITMKFLNFRELSN